MSSLKQFAANRANAKKPTGPTSPEGKAVSAMNALKTGLYAKSLVIPGENPEDLQTLINEYYAQYRPNNPDLRDLVDDLIASVWQVRRLLVTEVELEKFLEGHLYNADEVELPRGKVANQSFKQLGACQRRLDSARRARDRARTAVRECVKEQAAAPPVPQIAAAPAPVTPRQPAASTEIGFVPSTSFSGPVPTPAEPPKRAKEPNQAA